MSRTARSVVRSMTAAVTAGLLALGLGGSFAYAATPAPSPTHTMPKLKCMTDQDRAHLKSLRQKYQSGQTLSPEDHQYLQKLWEKCRGEIEKRHMSPHPTRSPY